jgi:hypothetical protein
MKTQRNVFGCTCKYRSLNVCDGCKNRELGRKFGLFSLGLIITTVIVLTIQLGGI